MDNSLSEPKTSGRRSEMSGRKTSDPVESDGVKKTWLFPAASSTPVQNDGEKPSWQFQGSSRNHCTSDDAKQTRSFPATSTAQVESDGSKRTWPYPSVSSTQVESDRAKQTWLFPAALTAQVETDRVKQSWSFPDEKHGALGHNSTRLKSKESESHNFEKTQSEKRKPSSTSFDLPENKRLRAGFDTSNPGAKPWTGWRNDNESSSNIKRMSNIHSIRAKTPYNPAGTESGQNLYKRSTKSQKKSERGLSKQQTMQNTKHELPLIDILAQDSQDNNKPGASHDEHIVDELLAYKLEAEVLKTQLSVFQEQAGKLESEKMRQMWEELDKSTSQSQATENKLCEGKIPTVQVRKVSSSAVCDVRSKKSEIIKKDPHQQTVKELPKMKMTGTVANYMKPKKRVNQCKGDDSDGHENTKKKKLEGKMSENEQTEIMAATNNSPSEKNVGPLEHGETVTLQHGRQMPVTKQGANLNSDDERDENLSDKVYQYKVLLLADSRGKDLKAKVEQQLLEQNRDEDVTYVFDTVSVDEPGAQMCDIYKTAEDTLKNNKYDIVYLLAGANHLIETNETGKITPLYNDIPTLLAALTDVFASIKNDITQLGHKLSICQLVGLDINQCNGTEGEFQDQQEVINKGVVDFNKTVVKFNIESDVVCPWLLNNIHSLVRGRRLNKYKRLPDGINPSEQTQTDWARLIAKATINNCSKFLNDQAEKDLLAEENPGNQSLEYDVEKAQHLKNEHSRDEITKSEAEVEITGVLEAEGRKTNSPPETEKAAKKPAEYKVLLLSDSTGKDLHANIESQLKMNNDKDVTYVFESMCIDEPGVRLGDIYKRAEDILNNKYDMVYVLAGVNHLIETHASGKVTPVYTDIPTLVDVLTNQFTAFKDAVNQLGNNVCFCQISGLDIDRFNGTKDEFQWQQMVIDHGVLDFNCTLMYFNMELNCVSPWLEGTIHGTSFGKFVTKYKKFHDGMNPDSMLQIQWAKLIASSIIRNRTRLPIEMPNIRAEEDMPEVEAAVNNLSEESTENEKPAKKFVEELKNEPKKDFMEAKPLEVERTACKADISTAKNVIREDESLENKFQRNEPPEKEQTEPGPPCERHESKDISNAENSTLPKEDAEDTLNDKLENGKKKLESVDHSGQRVMTKQQFKVLLLADSRGKDMNAKIDQELWELNMDDDITFIFETLYIEEPGARLEDIYKNAEDILRKNKYDMVYVLAGVNHLVETHPDGKVTPLYTDLPSLMDAMTDQFTAFKYALTQLGHRLCFCQLVGLDVNQYNGTEDKFQEQQQVINEGVVAFNEVITSFNKDICLAAPWLQLTVHDFKRGKRIHKYKKLPGGLNPDTRTQKEWAKLFAKATITNQRLSSRNCQNEQKDPKAVVTGDKTYQYKVLLLSDSRGKELEAMIDSKLLEMNKDEDYTFVLETLCIDDPGTRLEDIYQHAEGILKDNKYNIVYVLAGVNQLIETHPNGKVTPLYTDVPTFLDAMTDQFSSFKDALTRMGHKVCFCQLIGLDVNLRNGTTDEFQDQQEVLNEGLMAFNKVLTGINMESNVHSPWLLNSVHNLKGGKRHHKYKKLQDGINPDINLQECWATLFAKATITNCSRSLKPPKDALSDNNTSDSPHQRKQAVSRAHTIYMEERKAAEGLQQKREEELQERRAAETRIDMDEPSRQGNLRNAQYEYRVLLLADSRGKGIHHAVGMPLMELNKDENITYAFDVLCVDEPGARLVDIYRKAQDVLKNKKYDMVYLLAGVNNLTETHENGKVTPLYDDIPTLVDTLTKQFASFKHGLSQLGHKLCICQLIGIDINQCNKTEGWYQEHQQVINEGVIELNKAIEQFNTDSAVVCPLLLSSANRSHYEEYEQLLDGINPDIPTQHTWARQFATATITNCTRYLTELTESKQPETMDMQNQFRALLLTDSRGKEVNHMISKQLLEQNKDEDTAYVLDTLFVHEPGAQLEDIFRGAEDILKDNKYDIIYLLAGVNNLIETQENGKVTPLYNDVPTLVDRLTDQFKSVKDAITQLGHKLCICQLVGLDLNKYNGTKRQFKNRQHILNEGVIELNKVVLEFNAESGVLSPELLDTVHSLTFGERHHRYEKLADGKNPDKQTQNEWARLFAKVNITNCQLLAEKANSGSPEVERPETGSAGSEQSGNRQDQRKPAEDQPSNIEKSDIPPQQHMILVDVPLDRAESGKHGSQEVDNRQSEGGAAGNEQAEKPDSSENQAESKASDDAKSENEASGCGVKKPHQYKALLLADARGKDLDAMIMKELLELNKDENITFVLETVCVDTPGTRLEDIYSSAKDTLTNNKYDIVFVLAGVNHLIETHEDGKVTPLYTDVSTLVDVLTDQFATFRKTITDMGHVLCYCPIIGLDLNQFNGTEGEFKEQQKVINEGVIEMNRVVVPFNCEYNTVQPWLLNSVHSCCRGKYRHKYKKLPDGMHPDLLTQTCWAKQFAKSLLLNHSKLCQGRATQPSQFDESTHISSQYDQTETPTPQEYPEADDQGSDKVENGQAGGKELDNKQCEIERVGNIPSEIEKSDSSLLDEAAVPQKHIEVNETPENRKSPVEKVGNSSTENEETESSLLDEEAVPQKHIEVNETPENRKSPVQKVGNSSTENEETESKISDSVRAENEPSVCGGKRPHQYKALLLADARGKDLDAMIMKELLELNKDKNIMFVLETVCVDTPGTRLEDIYSSAKDTLTNNKYDIVFVLAGVNHLIETHEDGKVTPLFTDVPTLLSVLTDQFAAFKKTITDMGHLLCICQLIGVHLNQFNGTDGEFQEQQEVLNEGVVEFNKVIAPFFNCDSGTISPWLLGTVHHLIARTGKRLHKYKKLPDGMHPDTTMQTLWAKLFAKSLLVNHRKLCKEGENEPSLVDETQTATPGDVQKSGTPQKIN